MVRAPAGYLHTPDSCSVIDTTLFYITDIIELKLVVVSSVSSHGVGRKANNYFHLDAEVLAVIQEILQQFPTLNRRNYSIHINHCSLIKSILMYCGLNDEQQTRVLAVLSENKVQWYKISVHPEVPSTHVVVTTEWDRIVLLYFILFYVESVVEYCFQNDARDRGITRPLVIGIIKTLSVQFMIQLNWSLNLRVLWKYVGFGLCRRAHRWECLPQEWKIMGPSPYSRTAPTVNVSPLHNSGLLPFQYNLKGSAK